MGLIADCKTALSSLITSATGLTPGDYTGDEHAITATHPAIYLHWSGGTTQPNEIMAGGIHYNYDPLFLLYVAVEDGVTSGEVQAAGYLDQIRDVLTGYVIPSCGQVQPAAASGGGGQTEWCVGMHQGVYLYAQAWEVRTLQ